MTDCEELMPTDDEYLDMKTAYRLGKQHYPLDVVQVRWTEIEQIHFTNGWLYQQWLETQ